jgi:CHAD domain-containing protein
MTNETLSHSANAVEASTPAGEAAGRILLAKAQPLFELEAAAHGGTDMDAVHDMRVASRRVREALRLFAPLYRRRMFAEWDALFGHVTGSLGLVRDADVYVAAMRGVMGRAKEPDERVTLAYLIGHRQGVRAGDLRRMRKRLERLDLAKLRKRFEKAAVRVRDIPEAAQPLGAIAREAVETRVTAAFGHIPAALTPEDSASQHAMRIACKKLRYAVETLEPCFGDDYDDLHDLLVRFQDELGELHDLDVFLAQVRELRGSAEARAARVPAAGIDAVVRDLESRRARRFARFRSLAHANPESKVRAQLLGALNWMPPEPPAEPESPATEPAHVEEPAP